MTDRELMQQALDALESECDATKFGAAEALRARLAGWERVNMYDHKEGDLSIGTKPYAAQAAMVAQQTQGRMYVEPVTGDVGIGTVKWDASAPLVMHPHPAFQTTEPQREWIGLTDEEVKAAWLQLWYDLGNGKFAASDDLTRHTTIMFAKEIEAKLKEKNAL